MAERERTVPRDEGRPSPPDEAAGRGSIPLDSPENYINRELSWLSFARRVLALAEDRSSPLLERVKFAGIVGMLYDEFAMKRIGGIRRRIEKKQDRLSPDGRRPAEELRLCQEELQRQSRSLCDLVEKELRPALAAAGIPLISWSALDDEQQRSMEEYFRNSVEPILTPLAVDAGHPFPFISNLGLNLAVLVGHGGRKRFVRIKVPPNRPRWVPLPAGGYVPLEEVIAGNLGQLFPSAAGMECYRFRVCRGAKDDPREHMPYDMAEGELAPGCLIGMVTAELTARRYAGIVRLQVSDDMPEELTLWLSAQLGIERDTLSPTGGLMGIRDLVEFQPDGFPGLRDPPHVPVTHPRLRGLDARDTGAIFAEIRRGDILLHHPYQDFDTSVLHFLRSAARDTSVLAIKLTIYRTSRRSPIIQALTEAAMRGKQVAVLVEITARFDEKPNIAWGEQLEKAGAHVVYGMERHKTHVKLGLVVREEEDGIRRYIHAATGNYHTGTARLYEDLGILSCDRELSARVAAVFNELTGAISLPDYGPLMVAPHNLRQRFDGLIHREIGHAGSGRPCGIRAKMNQLQDPGIIRSLYLASRAGVPVTLNVRGLCCLRAGVPGLSENIKVFSTLGRFLEHGRIYRFENAGRPEFFIGSADWMRRNLDSRMETVMPVCDPSIRRELQEILDIYESDNSSAWDMQPDGTYRRRQPVPGEERRAPQEIFAKLAEEAGRLKG
jgi:polyphosphate kinase